ncbi:hypothetical protein FOS14_08075 [Skermania sp. ID1734]|uniref:hypothetical protein n=1 Tax=Skermania sp. ID1734 TaxID=2597516 RepID=UPI001180447D|nr:hypothetical protein [Skermania sp. ID1734]TSE00373.1 hypothetical protein FOS14_08075 [Skermania sp. ID1734]
MMDPVVVRSPKSHALVRPQGEPERRDSAGDRVPLRQLLAIATLTPAQAALLISDLLDRLTDAQQRGRFPVRLRDRAVMVSSTGELTVDNIGGETPWLNVDDAARIVRLIADNARLAVGSHDAQAAAHLDKLDESLVEPTDLPDLSRRVRQSIGPILDASDHDRVRGTRTEIGELVAVITGDSPATTELDEPQLPIEVHASADSLTPADWPLPRTNPWHRRRRLASMRRRILVVAVIVVLIGAAVAAPRVFAQLKRGWQAVIAPTEPISNQLSPVSPPPEPPTQGPSAPSPAPASAGPINAVSATLADGPCAPGQPCTIRVDVKIDPAPKQRPVSWELRAYDQCSKAVMTVGRLTVPVPAGAPQIYGVTRVAMPPGKAFAVVAVTGNPAAAASAPLLVPGPNVAC